MPLPGAAVLLSPWLDLALAGDSLVSRAHVDPLTTRAGLERAARLYIGDRDPTEPLISPVYAELAGLPPLLIQVGDHELLLDDARRLAERGRAAGVDVTLEIWPEMWHVWHGFAAELPEAQAAIDSIGAYVRGWVGKRWMMPIDSMIGAVMVRCTARLLHHAVEPGAMAAMPLLGH